MNKVFLNLGRQPLANSFLKNIEKNTLRNEFFYNLKICFNSKSYLVSIAKPVNPQKQYTDKNRYDKFSKKFYDNVQKYFIEISHKKKNYYTIDNSTDSNKVSEKILNMVLKKIRYYIH